MEQKPNEDGRATATLAGLRAELYGRPVELEVIVSGQSPAKNLPRTLVITVHRGRNAMEFKVDLLQEENYQYLRSYLFQPVVLRQDPTGRTGKVTVGEEGRIDYQILICRDVPETGNQEHAVFNTVPVHLIGLKAPPERRVKVRGRVVDDRDKNLVVFAYSCEPADDRRKVQFSEADHELFERYFRVPDIETSIDRSICPYVVGRADAKLAAALTLCSPAAFDFEGRRIRGNLHTMFCGDTTVGKSTLLKWIRDVLCLGEFGVGDMSSYAGLLAAVDTDHDTIVWGLLPLADRGIALIDSFQKLPPDDVPMFREALRDERITVRKKISGEAMCRARVLAAANPRQTLDSYVTAAEALRDIASISDPVDLTRWDLFVKFHARDVADEVIAEAHAEKPQIPADVLRKFVIWVWSLAPEDVVFTDAAAELIKQKFVEFSKLYCSELPLVHKGYKETIARIAAAFAALTYSVQKQDSKRILMVEERHVELACSFLRRLMRSWELERFIEAVAKVTRLEKDEAEQIKLSLQDNPNAARAFDVIASSQGIEAETLAVRLDLTRSEAVKAVAFLKSLDLVETRKRRSGYWLTPKGVVFAKLSCLPLEPLKKPQVPKLERVMEIIDSLDQGDGALMDEVLRTAAAEGIGCESVERIIEQGKQRGILFEPRLGKVARVRK